MYNITNTLYYINMNKFKDLISIIHPKYIEDLLNNNINSKSIVETKCPMCNEYAAHSMHSIYNFSKDKLKYDSAPVCSNCYMSRSSKSEIEIAEYISTFYTGNLIKDTRNIISPQELDLYYPEKKIAIEFNGDYWHNENHKDIDYHINKFLYCKEKCILLISIFEYDWNTRKDEIKEYLKDLFNDTENKLSFNEDHTLMNNNYPNFNYINDDLSIKRSYAVVNDNKIYTCGYSIIAKNILADSVNDMEIYCKHKNKRASIGELKEQYIGKTFNWLTVLDVFRDEKSKRYNFKCQCKCGNITNKQYNKVVSGHTKSCGCFNKSEEFKNKQSQWCIENSDKVVLRSEKYRQWRKDNPDKVSEMITKRNKTITDNPDIIINAQNKRKITFENNPEIQETINEKNRQFWKNNPDKRKEFSLYKKQYYNEHPEKCKEHSDNLIKYYSDNSDKHIEISDKVK